MFLYLKIGVNLSQFAVKATVTSLEAEEGEGLDSQFLVFGNND